MIIKTKHEIEKKIKEIWCGHKYYDDNPAPDNVTVEQVDGGWDITLASMYEAPVLNFQIVMKLAKWFDTMNINDSRFDHQGCETCDYGSSYGFTLNIREGDPFPND